MLKCDLIHIKYLHFFIVIFKIVAGAHKLNFEFGHQKRSIESMEANSNFNMQELADDISIITVSEPFDFSDPHVQPIETFKTDDAAIPDGTTCTSTGKTNRTSLNLSELKFN